MEKRVRMLVTFWVDDYDDVPHAVDYVTGELHAAEARWWLNDPHIESVTVNGKDHPEDTEAYMTKGGDCS